MPQVVVVALVAAGASIIGSLIAAFISTRSIRLERERLAANRDGQPLALNLYRAIDARIPRPLPPRV